MTEFCYSAETWRVVVPALIAVGASVGAWIFNERSKLKWEQYKRKEENYKELLRCLKGFYVVAFHKAGLSSSLSHLNRGDGVCI